MAWTTEREDLLRKLWLQGLSASQIAYVMSGVTRNAVIGKAHRMGLPKRSPATSHRPKPRIQRGKPSLACVGGKPAVRDGLADRQPRSRYDLDLEASAFEAEHAIVSSEDRVTLMTLTSKTCKWPIGDPADADFHFCSRDADNGRSYCEFHHRLAYQGIRRRRTSDAQPDVRRAAPLRAIAV
jgi:GcrA cell cycle regulator